jgi:hypothetical protein
MSGAGKGLDMTRHSEGHWEIALAFGGPSTRSRPALLLRAMTEQLAKPV